MAEEARRVVRMQGRSALRNANMIKSMFDAGEKKPLATLSNQSGIGIADLTCECLLESLCNKYSADHGSKTPGSSVEVHAAIWRPVDCTKFTHMSVMHG